MLEEHLELGLGRLWIRDVETQWPPLYGHIRSRHSRPTSSQALYSVLASVPLNVTR